MLVKYLYILNIKTFIVILFLLIINNSIYAQNKKVTTLEEAIELALQNHPKVQSKTLGIQKAEQLKSGAYLMPKMDLEGSFGQMNSRSIDQSYSISQRFNPFLSKVKKALGSEYVAKREYELDMTKQELIHHIKSLWNDYLFHVADLKLMQEKETFYKRFSSYANKKYEYGETNILEKSSADLQYQNLQRMLKNHTAQTEIIIEELERHIGAKVEIKAETYAPENWTTAFDTDNINQHPLVKSLLQDIQIANAQSKVQKAERKPEFMLGYFIQSIKGKQEIDNEVVEYEAVPRFQGVQVGVSLPVFGKGYKALKNARKTDALIAEAEAEQVKLDLSTQFNTLKYQYEVEQSNLDFYTNIALPNAQLISKNAQQAYEGGDIGYLEYMQALTTYFDTRLAYLGAIKSFNEIVYDIEYLID